MADEVLVDIVNMFGELLKDADGAESTFENLNHEYEKMTDTYEQIAEKTRFKGSSEELKNIIWEFMN